VSAHQSYPGVRALAIIVVNESDTEPDLSFKSEAYPRIVPYTCGEDAELWKKRVGYAADPKWSLLISLIAETR